MAQHHENIFSVMEGDCTSSLQAALDRTALAGERLVLAPGEHRCGALVLPSGVDLHLPRGAVLRFRDDYEAYRQNRVRVLAEKSDTAMMSAFGATNLRISGEGTILAPGGAYITGRLDDMGTHIPAAERPRVLVLHDCTNVMLEGVTIRQSPMWTIHLVACSNVDIAGLTIDNDREMPNTDGIVIDSCANVAIRHCDIATADDGVVLKTSLDAEGQPVGPCRSISVETCRVESRSCALKIGTETFSDVDTVIFRDCDVVRSNRALGIFSRDGGSIRNVECTDIRVEARETPDGFWGSGEAITLNVVDRRASRPAGPIEAITFQNMSGVMEGAINLVADGKAGIRNVVLRNVAIRQAVGRFNGGKYDMRPTRFDLAPSPDAAGRANAFVKDEDGAVIGLVSYPGGQPALYSENVQELFLEAVRFERPSPLPEGWNEKEVVLRQGKSGSWS